jgi:hypothetical protein
MLMVSEKHAPKRRQSALFSFPPLTYDALQFTEITGLIHSRNQYICNH